METLFRKDARKIIIQSQLLSGNKNPSKKDKLQKIIETLGYIQIDTISVVERSHNHILWTRLPEFEKTMLDKLVENKTVFEYWSHAAAYLPMRDYRFTLIRKENYSKRYKVWEKANKKIIKYVYDRIKREGALQSKDFEDVRSKSTGWWDWKPSKDALDFLFHQGKLMIAARKGFQKIYDLTERVLPGNIETGFPDEREFHEHLIFNSINSLGIVSEKEITYQRRYNKIKFIQTLNELLEDQKIISVKVDGIESTYFTTNEKLSLIKKILHPEIHILSPFDNLVIQRKKLKDFFGFDYTIECYVPQAKRKYGYYCMPVLNEDKFIARIDAKADRKESNFIIKNIFWEGKIAGERSLKEKILKLALFSGCDNISGKI